MTEQREITEPVELLDERGHLTVPGYARRPLWRYDRSRIRAPWYRIKEWDYYAVLSQERDYGITFTIADLGYMGLAAICWLDFARPGFEQVDTMRLLPRGRIGLPPTSAAGRSAYADRKVAIEVVVEEGRRSLRFSCSALGRRGPLEGELVLGEPPGPDSMVIATSWPGRPRAFYYNQKINCMPASGEVRIGAESYTFAPADSFGVLDWGRGNWTYRNRWYWGSASGMLEGVPIGWNLGYGFSDRSVASENMVFYGGRAHKLDQIAFALDRRDYLRPWRISSNDGRFEMRFEPLVDRHSRVDFILLKSIQHQLFGTYSGRVVLDGQALDIERQLGFAEDVLNWW